MIIYVLLLLVSTINLYLKNVKLYLTTITVMLVLTVLRYRIGTDWWVYDKLIDNAERNNNLLGLIEPASFALLKLTSIAKTRSYELLIFLQGILNFIALYKLRNKKSAYFGVFSFICLFFFWNFDVVRQSIAVSLFIIVSESFNKTTSFKLRVAISSLFHYSSLIAILILKITSYTQKIHINTLKIVTIITLLIYFNIDKVNFSLASKYGVFTLIKPEISLLVLTLYVIFRIQTNELLLRIYLICLLLFSWNIDLLHRVIYLTWPLLFFLEAYKNNFIKPYFIFTLCLITFYKNNFNNDVIHWRTWNGIWLQKDRNDDIKQEQKWHKQREYPF